MQTTPFQNFIELVQFDQSINRMREEVASLAHQTHLLQNTRDTLASALKKVRDHEREMRKAVDDYELEMKALDAR